MRLLAPDTHAQRFDLQLATALRAAAWVAAAVSIGWTLTRIRRRRLARR
ncbi:MAG: hypothetical protein U5K33_10165 [Halofilum sp. (in: g-proteobacteria)]|nr:hypothetical protein [Halofilum sp. (in: g-proteobacteria)]